MEKHKTFCLYGNQELIADGAILPSGTTVVEWLGVDSSFVCFPSFEDLKKLQDKQPSRNINFGGFSPGGYHLTTFRLRRLKVVTGISGDGVVAFGCYFHKGAVLEWIGEIRSIAYYPNGVSQIEKIHGHNGMAAPLLKKISTHLGNQYAQ